MRHQHFCGTVQLAYNTNSNLRVYTPANLTTRFCGAIVNLPSDWCSKPSPKKVKSIEMTIPFSGDYSEINELSTFQGRKGFDLQTPAISWRKLSTRKTINPRAAHSCDTLGNDSVVVFGGWNGTEPLQDLYIFSKQLCSWVGVATKTTPRARNNVRLIAKHICNGSTPLLL